MTAMIAPEWCQMMARYNTWQNHSLVTAADGLTDAERRADRGAFFGSIFATLNHLIWGDTVWMSRLGGWDKPSVPAKDHASFYPDWEAYKAARVTADARIEAWADGLAPENLAGDLSWCSGVLKADVQKPRALCIAQLFNHQSHHRGQIHAMLTAAGARPDDTDIFLMPDAD